MAKTKEFQLSAEQIKQQTELNNAMAKSTLLISAALQKAYEKYAAEKKWIARSPLLPKDEP